MAKFEVIVYISTGCPYCEKVKTQLEKWGIEYEERNVSLHKEYFDQLRKNKIFGTPATYVNGKLILGFQEKKFKKALGIDDEVNKEIPSETNNSTVEAEVFEQLDKDVLNTVYDFVMIGGDAAGASAAVYSASAKLSTLVIDKAAKSEQVALTQKIAKYPGVREEVTGFELLTRMQAQAKDFGAKFVRSNVISVNFTKDIKEIIVPEGKILAKAVFIAVGAKAPSSTDFIEEAVCRDDEGYIVVDDHLRTNVPGVFAGGDARRNPFKQTVISAADGAIAALGADEFVNKRTKLKPQF
ncbi:hypothetical protein BKP35_17560 [Anaerobacillus arseniciselenatis]|uniref:Uncharacterized protein n=1 Tax=Anaerobacillus arseniciselenatis TaxID=85682 RepID=A0A1S2L858_9BACI|nr:FAD-dependent oxidoreductase [Anaerobacillus arseniciselenatis]OIJ08526.1 hypothetical protein BKP35_17560 [Anaerobacillus arseniciselenatis]